jgi:nicotinamidase-related amidase
MAALPETSNWLALGPPGRNTYRVSDEVVDLRRPERQVSGAQLRAQPQNLVIDRDRCALVIIDMQNDFCSRDGWIGQLGIDVAPALALAAPINRAASAFRQRGAPVLWVNWGVRPDRLNLSPGTQHPFNPNGRGAGLAGDLPAGPHPHKLLEKDSWGARIIDQLEQASTDIYVDKHRISGFWDTPLDAILSNLGVHTLFFAGVNADHCVLGTLMDANFHGYDTVLLEDCTSTTSPDFCFQATLHNVRFCFGFTATSRDLAEAIAA